MCVAFVVHFEVVIFLSCFPSLDNSLEAVEFIPFRFSQIQNFRPLRLSFGRPAVLPDKVICFEKKREKAYFAKFTEQN